MRTRTLSLLAILSLSTAAACSAEGDDESANGEAAITDLQTYWGDAKKLNLDDLTRASVGFATGQLNNTLSSGGSGISIHAPQVFGAQANPNRVLPKSVQIKGLDEVVSGLAARFGEKELGTEVNATRLKHLQEGADKYYIESAFTTKLGLDHTWNLAGDGFDSTSVTLGFDAGAQLTSRVILAAPDDKIDSLVESPLTAAKDMRGFVYPQTLADIRGMKPGEMFALRGLGKLGANFGVGVPLLVAEPTGSLGYRILVSAGVAGVIGGQIDVQLLRLDGDEVVVDVGVENGRGISFHAGVSDGFGIKGICDDGKSCLRDINLGGANVNLATMVAKAVEKRMGGYLTFKIEGQTANSDSRVSLSRFRFHLDAGNQDEVEKALQRALKFDIRLAQALYNRDLDQAHPAVVAELDAVRASTTSMRSFGFEILGMNIYHKAVVKNEGSFILQTPDGAQSILFDSLTKTSGWFSRDHKYTRTGVAAQTLDARNPDNFRSEANLILQTSMGDKGMYDDYVLDNVDGLLLGIVGTKGVETLDKYGSQMERLVKPCVSKQDVTGSAIQRTVVDEQCNVNLINGQMADLKARGLSEFEPLISGLPQDFQNVAREAAKVRLTLQEIAIGHFDNSSSAASTFSLDVRLDDKALENMTNAKQEDYEAALVDYLVAINAKRADLGAGADKATIRADLLRRHGGDIHKMGAKFAAKALTYKLISEAEALIPSKLGRRFVSYPLGLRFAVDRDNQKMLNSAVIQSTSQDRAKAAGALFDGLRDTADDEVSAPLYDEYTAMYPLLQLVKRENLQVGMTVVTADLNGSPRFQRAGFAAVSAAGKGSDVSTISAGMFDLDAIVSPSTK